MKRLMVIIFVLFTVGLSAQILKMQNFENFKSDNWNYNSTEIKQSRKVHWGPTDKTINGITAKAGSRYWLGKGLKGKAVSLNFESVPVVKDDISNYEIKFDYYSVGLGSEGDYLKYSISYDNGKNWVEMDPLALNTGGWKFVKYTITDAIESISLKIETQFSYSGAIVCFDNFSITQKARAVPRKNIQEKIVPHKQKKIELELIIDDDEMDSHNEDIMEIETIQSTSLYRNGSTPKFVTYDNSYNRHHAIPQPDNFESGANDFNNIKQNEFIRTETEPLSTFSIDVDTGSYSVVRKHLNQNRLPDGKIIRTEELINYFDYDYPQPKDEHPFAIYTELGTCPWNDKRLLAHIGLQGKTLDLDEAPASNLVFLLDVSGSMNSNNKLPLVKSAMKMLIDGLRNQDKISIVTYAGSAGLALEPTSGENKERIKEALNNLSAGGSTAGGQGIQLAYKVAEEQFIKGGNNRIILCSDGDFNVGVSNTDALIKMVEEKAKSNIFLSILGFGMGNLKDSRLEQIANKGNGTYGYIDNIIEAKKVFVNELSSSLYTIAKDVKIQVEFNPAWVRAYRLIGYENRMLKKEDFRDDTKDAGELGAGHTVTAIYEIIPVDSKEDVLMVEDLRYQKPAANLELNNKHNDELLLVKLRYKLPEEDVSIPLNKPLLKKVVKYNKCCDSFRFSAAVVGYAMLLQDHPSKGDLNWKKVIELARSGKGKDKFGYRAEFIRLAEIAELLEK